MKSKDLMEKARTQFAAEFLAAIGNGDENAVAEAVTQLSMDIQEALWRRRTIPGWMRRRLRPGASVS